MNLFASWCPPCNAEAPELAELSRWLPNSRLVVVGIDEGEDVRADDGFAKRYALPYRIAVDPAQANGRALNSDGLPTQAIFDTKENLAYEQICMLDGPAPTTEIHTLLAVARSTP